MTGSTEGVVLKAFGNLIHAKIVGSVRFGGIGYVVIDKDTKLKAEVMEIDGNIVKMQCFEDTYGVYVGCKIEIHGNLLEAELGPGLLGSVFDGLQNPLNKIKEKYGFFIKRGKYFRAISNDAKWNFVADAKSGDIVKSGDLLGYVEEKSIKHLIYVPAQCQGEWIIDAISSCSSISIDHVVAVISKDGFSRKITLSQKWPVKTRMAIGKKVKPNNVFYTGIRIIDTLFPIVKGGTFCTPGPFGAGKTVLQHHFTKWSQADVVVVVACGERAGEIVQILADMKNLVDPKTKRPMIERTIMICNTSSMPTASREASIYTGLTISEYYMNMGLDVLCLADSTSRWAQAMRELSGRLEEIPGEEAFPAYLGSRIAQIYERSGSFIFKGGREGSITFGGTVSPSGGNFEEPVTQKTLSVVNVFLGLSRERAGARKFPSVDPLISWSKNIEVLKASKGQYFIEMVMHAIEILKRGSEIEQRIEVVGEDGVAIEEYTCFLKAGLFDFCFLQQNSFDSEDMYAAEEKRDSMLEIMHLILNNHYSFSDSKDARDSFVSLKFRCNALKYAKYQSHEYNGFIAEINDIIKSKRYVSC